MDVHKNSIDIAIAQAGHDGKVRHYGHVDGSLSALDKAVRKLDGKGRRLHFVYEAMRYPVAGNQRNHDLRPYDDPGMTRRA